MKKENNKETRMEQILSSLDGIERAQPQPWFYTRLRVRLEKHSVNGWEKVSKFLSRPAVVFATLCIVLVLNVFFLMKLNNTTPPSGQVAQNDPVQDSESLIASSSSFDYENITP